ncbi:MAG: hypothetical protein DDT35_00895 [Firmicutes bacterium]|nr:hypothetical protein [Bacillota bacterium]
MGNDLRQVVEDKLRTLIYQFERMKLAEYVALMNNPWRLFWVNFLLSQVAILNLPLVSDVIAEKCV